MIRKNKRPRTVSNSSIPSKAIQKALEHFLSVKELSQEHLNAFNRAKTSIKKEIVKYLADNNYDSDAIIQYKNNQFTMAKAPETERIIPEKWFQLYQAQKITKEEFLKTISVSKEVARIVAGEDRVRACSEITPGKTVDLRVSRLDGGTNELVVISSPKKPNKTTQVLKPKKQIMVRGKNVNK